MPKKSGNEGSRGAEGEYLRNRPHKVTSGGYLDGSSHRSHFAEFQDRASTVGQAVTLYVKYLGGIGMRDDSW